MLYLVGLGLSCKGVSLEGLEVVKKCEKVFFEAYTSRLDCCTEELKELFGEVILADREMVEKQADRILVPAKSSDVALLVIGDPLCATTHHDILSRAEDAGVEVRIIHGASIISAVGATGLQVYKFGRTASIPFPEGDYVPETPYNILKENKSIGAHTLFLLDLRPEENRYMSVNDAIKYLLKIEEKKKEGVFTKDTVCVGCARLGQDSLIKSGTAERLSREDFGRPVHCLIVPGELHFVEEESLARSASAS